MFPTSQNKKPSQGYNAPYGLAFWVIDSPIILDGQPFSFKNHEYLKAPYTDQSSHIVVKKGNQLGYSVYALLKGIHGCAYTYRQGALYLLPTSDIISDFADSKLKRLTMDNPTIFKKLIKGTDRTHLKDILGSPFYFHGTKSKSQLAIVSVDLVIYDERDLMDDLAIRWGSQRLHHSEYKHILSLSKPSLPDWGIDREWQNSDRKEWFTFCEKCKEYTQLSQEFPNCIDMVGGKYIRRCKHCGETIHPAIGKYIPQNPTSTISGYHVSQLDKEDVDLDALMDEFSQGEHIEEFYNSRLGLAYIDAVNRLEVNQVLSLCGLHKIQLSDKGPCSMGVDQGKDLHVVIGKKLNKTTSRIVYIGIKKEWSELDELMIKFNVRCCVVDGLPNTTNAREFANRFWGRIFVRQAYYGSRGGIIDWDMKEMLVKCNRNEVIDSFVNIIRSETIELPAQCDIVKEYARHCHATMKKEETDLETGVKRQMWVKSGEDHFFHASVYSNMASQRISIAYDKKEQEDRWDKDDMWDRGGSSRPMGKYGWMAV